MGERYYPEVLKWTSLTQEYFCIDLETTSLEPEGEGILELYWKHMRGTEKIEEGHRLFWHSNFYKTRRIHQIPLKELLFKKSFSTSLKNEDVFLNTVADYIRKCCDPNSDISFMAHYAPFEIKWLEHHLKMDLSNNQNLKVYDTRSVERYLNPDVESASLIPTCKRRGIESPNGVDFHRAQWDVDAMYKVALQQFEKLKERGHNIGDKWRTVK